MKLANLDGSASITVSWKVVGECTGPVDNVVTRGGYRQAGEAHATGRALLTRAKLDEAHAARRALSTPGEPVSTDGTLGAAEGGPLASRARAKAGC